LAANTYTLTIRDANSCTTNILITITQAATAVAGTILNQTDITCYGEASGSVTVEGSGGTPPYDYSIDGFNYQVAGGFTGLAAGDYNVIVRDANRCTFTIPLTLLQPASSLLGSVDGVTNIICYGDATGEIIVSGSGGTPPYEYSVNGGSYQASGTFTGLAAAQYTITIRDGNLCTTDVLVAVSGPEEIVIDPAVTPASCTGIEDGSIVLNAGGGVPPYDYLWSNMEVTADIFELLAGDYTVQITDASGCTVEYDIEVPLSGVECLLIPNAFIPNDDGMNDTWRIRDIESYPNASIKVYSRWGQLVFSSERGYPTPWDGTYKGKELPMDSYFYVIDLKNGGKVITGQVTIIR
jgi:gliding motility-associated-like protein